MLLNTLNQKNVTNILKILGILCLISIGFLLGRCSQNQEKEIQYLPGKPIKDSVIVKVPYKVEVPGEPVYLTKRDTITKDSLIYVTDVIDTSAIIKDWILKRSYESVLFNIDTVGKLTIYADVQYNKLTSLKYDFLPIHKNIITYKEKTFKPFMFVGVNSFCRPELEIGTFIKNVGVCASLSHDKNDYIYSLKVGFILK